MKSAPPAFLVASVISSIVSVRLFSHLSIVQFLPVSPECISAIDFIGRGFFFMGTKCFAFFFYLLGLHLVKTAVITILASLEVFVINVHF